MICCEVCGSNVEYIIISADPRFRTAQKIFFVCGKDSCRRKITDYIKERGEIVGAVFKRIK